ncbi:hypothetical protein AZE42_10085 [Rhizopogon vesiculosus]|uniref:Uncharacterized protein n=1 Tax=Rhizopogon vesiculosus TaxID=180088 RepID=A0A1J8Q1M3_9AGAM|nr:hypothetical protein AZE42_10085 [Rhizopogon vesiculosus]
MHFLTTWGPSGHRLFVSAFMLTTKVICSDTYSNKSWSVVNSLLDVYHDLFHHRAVDGAAMRSEDDLTYKLGEIIKAPAHVRGCEEEGAPAPGKCRRGEIKCSY